MSKTLHRLLPYTPVTSINDWISILFLQLYHNKHWTASDSQSSWGINDDKKIRLYRYFLQFLRTTIKNKNSIRSPERSRGIIKAETTKTTGFFIKDNFKPPLLWERVGVRAFCNSVYKKILSPLTELKRVFSDSQLLRNSKAQRLKTSKASTLRFSDSQILKSEAYSNTPILKYY